MHFLLLFACAEFNSAHPDELLPVSIDHDRLSTQASIQDANPITYNGLLVYGETDRPIARNVNVPADATTPKLSAYEAKHALSQRIGASTFEEPELVFYPVSELRTKAELGMDRPPQRKINHLKLAWKIEVWGSSQSKRNGVYLISAQSSEILAFFPDEDPIFLTPATGEANLYVNALFEPFAKVGTGNAEISTGYNPITGMYHLQDPLRNFRVENGNRDNRSITSYSDVDNLWGTGFGWEPTNLGATDSADGQTIAVDVLKGFADTHDMLRDTFGYTGELAKFARTHSEDANRNPNALALYFRRGDFIGLDSNWSASSRSIIAHETGHSVVYHSGINTQTDSEAQGLNEGFADITAIATYAF